MPRARYGLHSVWQLCVVAFLSWVVSHPTSRAMAPHMTTDELDFAVGLHAAGHLSVVQIHARLAAKRGRKGRA